MSGTRVWAFGGIGNNEHKEEFNEQAREKVYQAIKEGKSRFGLWDQKVSLKEEHHGENGFLLEIKEGDWIVHVHLPKYDGSCVAVRVTGEYGFDEGIECNWSGELRKGYRNYIPVDPNSIVEFHRSDSNIVPSVNLKPRPRAHEVHRVEEFLESIANVKSGRYSENEDPNLHLKNKTSEWLLKLTARIHEMNGGKKLEYFLHDVFKAMPNVVSTAHNGAGGSDHGADIIVDFAPITNVSLTTRLVVQVKSYKGDHDNLGAVDQIVKGIPEYEADAGLLITTANATEGLKSKIDNKSKEIGKSIGLMAGADVARFVLRHAPELLLGEVQETYE